ncbi:MAG: alpha/beta fold hydrolase [Pseudoruegeria sp.]
MDNRSLHHISPVLGLHCSGANGLEWRRLANLSAGPGAVVLPEFLGNPSRGHWTKARKFSLADEASGFLTALLELGRPCHIVGHSFGGAVGLHILRHHPELVASLCLYEPTCFHVLRDLDEEGVELLQGIIEFNDRLKTVLLKGKSDLAARMFTDFWSGEGSYDALTMERKEALGYFAPKAVPDFEALLWEAETAGDLNSDIPVTLIYGEHTQLQTRRIIDVLSGRFNCPSVHSVTGAAHMGPFTHRDIVNELVVTHIIRAEIAIGEAKPQFSG